MKAGPGLDTTPPAPRLYEHLNRMAVLESREEITHDAISGSCLCQNEGGFSSECVIFFEHPILCFGKAPERLGRERQ
jgi:hypothetical protein